MFSESGFNTSYLETLERMLELFGLLGVVERREQHKTKDLPEVLYVEQGMDAPMPPDAPMHSQALVHRLQTSSLQ